MTPRERILERSREIEALPVAVAEVLRMLDDPEVDIGAVVLAIEHDPGLTSNLLRLANSAYFAGPRSIGSVRDAIVRLGLNRMFQLALASAVAPLASAPVRGYDLPSGNLLDHCIAVAVGVEKLAETLELSPPPYTFTAALLHDLGKIVLGTFLEVDVKPLLALAYEHQVSFDKAEAQVLGVDHAQVGAAVLEHWNLPAPVVEVVRWHHEPDNCPAPSLALDLVHVADSLAMLSGVGAGVDGLNYQPSRDVMARLHVTPRISEAVVNAMLVGLEELRDVFMEALGRKS